MSASMMLDLAGMAPVRADSAEPAIAAGFSAPERFVLHCLANDASSARTLLADDFDLEAMARFALHHEVVGEVAAFCEQAALSLPQELTEGLRLHADRLAAHRDKISRETVRLAARLAGAGVAAAFGKGAVAGALYREAGVARTSKDLDIYVRANDLPALLAALPDDYELFPDALPIERAVATRHHVSAWAGGEGIAVEIHFALAAPRHALPFDLPAAIDRRRPLAFGGGTVPTFCPADAIGFWSIELSKDSWTSGKKILDFARCVAGAGDEALRTAFDAARALGTSRMLRIGLIMAERLSFVRLSPLAASLAEDDAVAARVADICMRRLAGCDRQNLGLAQRVSEGIAFARKHDSLPAQLRHVWNIIVLYRAQAWLDHD